MKTKNDISHNLQHLIYSDFGRDFILDLEEIAMKSIEKVNDFLELYTKEITSNIINNLYRTIIAAELDLQAKKYNFPISITPTEPHGYFYLEIVSESFITTPLMSTSKNWTHANYAKELACKNESLESRTGDLLRQAELGDLKEKIFLPILIHVGSDLMPKLIFVLPHSDLKGWHFRFTSSSIIATGDSYKEKSMPVSRKVKLKQDIKKLDKKTGTV